MPRLTPARRLASLLALSLMLATGGQAVASPPPPRPRPGATLEVATDPEHPGPPVRPAPVYHDDGGQRGRRGRGDVTVGLLLSAGRARQKYSKDGYFGRIASRFMFHDEDAAGPAGAVIPLSLDFWNSPNGWGFGFPVEVGFGYASPRVMLLGSLGLSVVTIDHERDKTGFGLYSPLAGASLGLNFDPVRVSFDARAVYRWHIKTVDTPQTQVGLSFEFFSR